MVMDHQLSSLPFLVMVGVASSSRLMLMMSANRSNVSILDMANVVWLVNCQLGMVELRQVVFLLQLACLEAMRH